MDPILIIALAAFVILAMGAIVIEVAMKRRLRNREILLGKFQEAFSGAVISEETGKPYEYQIETATAVLLIKVIRMNPLMELIVTNPDFWCINADPRSWNRSSAPVLIPGVPMFRAATVTTEKKVLKIGVVYPGCTNISRYLNESEVEIVKPTTDVHGVRLVRFADLDEIFSQLEKK